MFDEFPLCYPPDCFGISARASNKYWYTYLTCRFAQVSSIQVDFGEKIPKPYLCIVQRWMRHVYRKCLFGGIV